MQSKITYATYVNVSLKHKTSQRNVSEYSSKSTFNLQKNHVADRGRPVSTSSVWHCQSSHHILAYQSDMRASTQGSVFIGRDTRLCVINFLIW